MKIGILSGEDTLKDGLEVTSHKFVGAKKEYANEIHRICTLLKAFGQESTNRCGGHVHVGADYLKSVQAWKNLVELWCNAEEIIYIISNKEGEIPRPGVLTYAKPQSLKFEQALEKGAINLENEEDLDEFIRDIVNVQRTEGDDGYYRYFGINFSNVGKNKNTVEFRLANEPLDSDIWIQNINLFGGIVRAAQNLAIIQEKPLEQRTEKEKRILQCFENLRSGEFKQEEELLDFLEIVIQEESQRDVYIKRYNTNSKLLKENPEFYEKLKEKFSKRKIKLTKGEIGEVVFGGKEKPKGEDYTVTSEVLEGILQNRNVNHTK